MRNDHPSQTRCPKCKANLWLYPERALYPKVRCVCGNEFMPEEIREYVTGDEKRAAQED